jgi:hypothetical protein
MNTAHAPQGASATFNPLGSGLMVIGSERKAHNLTPRPAVKRASGLFLFLPRVLQDALRNVTEFFQVSFSDEQSSHRSEIKWDKSLGEFAKSLARGK